VNVRTETLAARRRVLNVAVTVTLLLIWTVQEPVPVQQQPPPPLHPANTNPEAGTAVSATLVPPENDREQVVPQLMPLGLLVTVPPPVPFLVTWSVKVPLVPLPLAFNPAGGFLSSGWAWSASSECRTRTPADTERSLHLTIVVLAC
jgi:hypothetical protein